MDMRLELEDIRQYTFFLQQEERSLATIEKYIRDIRKFYNFSEHEELLTKKIVIEFKDYLSEKYKTSSANSILASVNGFLVWKGYGNLRVKSLKTQKQMFCHQQRELNIGEYKHLVEAAQKSGRYRLAMIMQTIGATGIRISELSSITAEAVKQGEVIVKSKGKQRVVFLTPRLRKYLLRYCRRKKINSGPVFITRSGRNVDRSNIWREMKQLCKEAGVKETKVFPHNLRHLFARTCYQKNKDIVYLADLLGHSNIETTRIYTITSGCEHKKMLSGLGLVI